MLARWLLLPWMVCALAGCGDDPVPQGGDHELPLPGAVLAADAGVDQVRGALTRLGIDAGGLAPLKYDSTKRLLAFPVAAKDALATWTKLRQHVAELQRWPLILKDPDDVLGNVSPEKYAGGVAGIIAESTKINSGLWLDERERGDPEYYRGAPQGEWQEVREATEWAFPTDFEGKPTQGLVVALVPTVRPWEVCAWLFYGGWNACPPPAVHVAVQERWHRLYGAEIVCATNDVLEMRCARRPKDRDGALALAREQFIYSGGDLIYQGVTGMRELASSLLGSDAWYFWWD